MVRGISRSWDRKGLAMREIFAFILADGGSECQAPAT
jgi:hypothetical protein